MAYRYLMDADGETWRVWDVRPTLIDRRSGIRRVKVLKIKHAERRILPTRRVDMSRSQLYFPPQENGWLCFESERQRVRLRPIPDDWPILPDDQLDRLRRAAATSDGDCEEVCAERPGSG